MFTIPDFGRAHEACGGVLLVWLVHNPPPTSGQKKKSNNTKAETEINRKYPIRIESTLITINKL